jgi:3-oxoadipate enol-lactonase
MTTVVLCGSLGSTSAMWDEQRAALGGHRVVAVEHPGHGGAPLADVHDMHDLAATALATVDDETFSVVGLSLGGAVGMQLALDVPERVERLVLASTSLRFGEPEQWTDRAEQVRTDGLESIVDAVLARWFTPSFGDADRFREMFLSTDAEGYARCCEVLSVWDAGEQVQRVRAPTLVISATGDPTAPPEHGARIAAAVPGATHAVIRHAGHLANVERPGAFNRLMEEHL